MINEHQKFPTNKERYDNNYNRIFPKCPACKGKGYIWGWDRAMEHYIKYECTYCKGRGTI